MARVLVTGGAGFIGSHIVDALLARGDEVVVFDNLATGRLDNLKRALSHIELVEADLRDFDAVRHAMAGVDLVSHQAALGSVPRSLADPRTSNDVNVNGTLNVLVAAREAGVRRLVNASSSSVYGDTEELPKHEGMPLRPISPYALSKATAEEYARVFHGVYGTPTLSLRYFNVFGPRQNPDSQYAAAIPRFMKRLAAGERPQVYGDGSRSRDFTFVQNVVHANLLALSAPDAALGRSYNIGAGGQVGILDVIAAVQRAMGTSAQPEFIAKRDGDVLHSRAAIDAAREAFGYVPSVGFEEGIRLTVEAFRA